MVLSSQTDTYGPLQGARSTLILQSLVLCSLAKLHLTHSPMMLTKVLHEIPSPCRGRQRADSKLCANLL